MSDRYRLAIIGTGGIAHAHLGAARKIPAIDVIAVADTEPGKARAFADKQGIKASYDSAQALLENEAPDIVVLGTWPSVNRELVEMAAPKTKAILCQKPMATTSVDARAMLKAAEKAGCLLMEAFMFRHHPQSQKIADILKNGDLGKVGLIRSAFAQGLGSLNNWRRRKDCGGGSLMDLGCYCVNFSLAFAGARPVEVIGKGWINPESQVEENIAGIITFENGVVAIMDSRWPSPWRENAEIVGSLARLDIARPFTPGWGPTSFTAHAMKGDSVTYTFADKPGDKAVYELELQHLVDCLRNKGTPRVDPKMSVLAMEVIDALYQSLRDGGRPVSLK